MPPAADGEMTSGERLMEILTALFHWHSPTPCHFVLPGIHCQAARKAILFPDPASGGPLYLWPIDHEDNPVRISSASWRNPDRVVFVINWPQIKGSTTGR